MSSTKTPIDAKEAIDFAQEYKIINVADEPVDTSSNQNTQSEADSTRFGLDNEVQYVKGHPVIRNGDCSTSPWLLLPLLTPRNRCRCIQIYCICSR